MKESTLRHNECYGLVTSTVGATLSASRFGHLLMFLEPSKVSRVEIASTLLILPLIIWLTLYLAERRWSINWGPALPWLKTLRWIGWAVGTALFLVSLITGRLPWVYGIAMTGFSTGLSMPESWMKRRLG